MKQELESQEPPHVIPSDVDAQVKDLQVRKKLTTVGSRKCMCICVFKRENVCTCTQV